MKINVLILQLDGTEQAGFIADYFNIHKVNFEIVHLFEKTSLIGLDRFSHLIVLPSPKDTFECEKFPFLALAKKIIRDFIAEEKFVLGVCMGCQLIAECVGETVSKMQLAEVGFYEVGILKHSPIITGLPTQNFEVFEWHSMEVSTEKNISVIAKSEKCKTQIFQYRHNVFGVQFHIEINERLLGLYLKTFDADGKHSKLLTMKLQLEKFSNIQNHILNNFLNLKNVS